VEVHRPYSSSITMNKLKKLNVGCSKLEVFPSSHVTIREKGDKDLLAICSLKRTKQPQSCYMFAAYNDKEVEDLTKLQHFVEDLCESE